MNWRQKMGERLIQFSGVLHQLCTGHWPQRVACNVWWVSLWFLFTAQYMMHAVWDVWIPENCIKMTRKYITMLASPCKMTKMIKFKYPDPSLPDWIHLCHLCFPSLPSLLSLPIFANLCRLDRPQNLTVRFINLATTYPRRLVLWGPIGL